MPLFRIEVLREIPSPSGFAPVTREEREWVNLQWCEGMVINVPGSPEEVLTRLTLGIPPRRVLLAFLCARYMEGNTTANTLHPVRLDLSGRARE